MVNVAQVVEHQIVALVAVGSSPTIHPKKLLQEKTEYLKKKLNKNLATPLKNRYITFIHFDYLFLDGAWRNW